MNPRIQRGAKPDKALTPRNYRDALPELRRDFQDRCAYFMQHLLRAGGLKCMEVDHFDPRQKHDAMQAYDNLFLASRHCNGSKRDYWPTKEDLALGIRMLNPCEEYDYGEHIFEHPITHKLVGTTIAGRNQIIVCDLDAPHLVAERKQRSDLLAAILRLKNKAKAMNLELPTELLNKLERAIDYMIPEIPSPPE